MRTLELVDEKVRRRRRTMLPRGMVKPLRNSRPALTERPVRTTQKQPQSWLNTVIILVVVAGYHRIVGARESERVLASCNSGNLV